MYKIDIDERIRTYKSLEGFVRYLRKEYGYDSFTMKDLTKNNDIKELLEFLNDEGITFELIEIK